jgi:4'-phosphopantetheinyl transferase EntD
MDYKNITDNKLYISCSDFVNIKSFFTSDKQELSLDKLCLPQSHNFSPKRLSDFSTGRYCATKALEQLGIHDAIIPIGKDREPIWPDGIVGSISHCDSLVGAIVAKKSDHVSLGLDIEEIGRVTPDLWDLVFTENEKQYLIGLSEKEMFIQSTSIFSAKEAFYKFQHPLTKTFLDFLDVEVDILNFKKIILKTKNLNNISIISIHDIIYLTFGKNVISVVCGSKV